MAHAIVQPSYYVIYANASANNARPSKTNFRVNTNQLMGRQCVHQEIKLSLWILVKRQHLNNLA